MNMAWAFLSSWPRVDLPGADRGAGIFRSQQQETIQDQDNIDPARAHRGAQFGRVGATGCQPAGPDGLSPRCDQALLLAYRQARRNAALPGPEQGPTVQRLPQGRRGSRRLSRMPNYAAR